MRITIAFIAGGIFVYGLQMVYDVLMLRLYPPTPIGAVQWRITSGTVRSIGLGTVYDPKMRALRILGLACKLAVTLGLPMHAASTMLALRYSEPPDNVEAVYGELGIATILGAHVHRIGLAAAMVKRMQLWERKN